jgi:hypothetical protein
MYQAYKLSAHAHNINIYSSKNNHVLTWQCKKDKSFQNIVSNCKNAQLVAVVTDTEIIYHNQPNETEVNIFIQDCFKYQVTSPLLVILKVW